MARSNAIWRICVFSLFIVLLSACGGSGGGGNDSSNEPPSSSGNPPLSAADSANAWLPTDPSIKWTYNDNVQAGFLPDDVSSGAHVHAFLYPTGGKEYFVTDIDRLSLQGLYLPTISVGDGVNYTGDVRFNTLLTILQSDWVPATSFNVSGTGTINISPAYGKRNIDFTGTVNYVSDETVSTALGSFTAKRVSINLILVATIEGRNFQLPYNVTFWLAKNVGIVKRDQEGTIYLLSSVEGIDISSIVDTNTGTDTGTETPPDDGSSPGNDGGSPPDNNGGEGTGSTPGDDGSNTDNGNTPPFTVAMNFDVPKLTAEYDVGETRSLTIKGTTNLADDAGAYIFVQDPLSNIVSLLAVLYPENGSFSVGLQIQNNLAAGNHHGNLTIRICKDMACAEQYAGSPVTLPYEIHVVSISSNLKPLAPLVGAGDWETYRGNAAHTGAVPVTLNVQDFSRRWRWTAPDQDVTDNVSSVVTYQGQVFAGVNDGPFAIYASNGGYINALSEDTGSVNWSNRIPCCYHVYSPAVSNGSVYALNGAWGLGPLLSAFDTVNGATKWDVPFARADNYSAPAVKNGLVFQHAGYNHGGLAAYAADSGTNIWHGDLWDVGAPGALAADDTYAYAVMIAQSGPYAPDPANRPVLYMIDQNTGNIVKSIYPSSNALSLTQISPTPVVAGNNSIILGYFHSTFRAFRVEKIDTALGKTVWSVETPVEPTGAWPDGNSAIGQAGTEPVVIDGVVYFVNPGTQQVEARRESDGSLLWTWSPPAVDQAKFQWKTSLLAVSNMVFVSTDRFVYAISTTSGKTVWRYWNAGELAMSANGILYISKQDGVIDAVNLH